MGVTFPPQSSKIISKTMTPWPFHQNHMFHIAKLSHQMWIRQNWVHCQVAHSICYHLSFNYGGWLSRLNPLKLSQRQWPLDFSSKSHVRHSKTKSPDVDTTKLSTLPGSLFNLLSFEFYLWGWPSRLNPLKLSQRQWPLDLFIKITCST